MVLRTKGPGVPDTDRIFEPFFTTKDPGQGTGLGLAMVHRFAHAFGGSVRAENVPGGGARFTLRLPLASPGEIGAAAAARAAPDATIQPARRAPGVDTAAAQPEIRHNGAHHPSVNGTGDGVPEPEARSPAGLAGKRPLRVLVVDDEAHVRRLQERILTSIEVEVLLADSVSAAREILARDDVDLVVSDVRMPGESGLDLFRWVESRKPDLARRFLFVTGDTTDPELMNLARLEPGRFVQKPFRIHDYLTRIRAVLPTG